MVNTIYRSLKEQDDRNREITKITHLYRTLIQMQQRKLLLEMSEIQWCAAAAAATCLWYKYTANLRIILNKIYN